MGLMGLRGNMELDMKIWWVLDGMGCDRYFGSWIWWIIVGVKDENLLIKYFELNLFG